MTELSVNVGEPDAKGKRISPWAWIPTINFASGIPFAVASLTAVAAYKTLGKGNAEIAFWTSLLYLPWTIKPLWGPLVEKYGTKRNWALWMQLALALAFGLTAVALQMPFWFAMSLVGLFAVAICSATHDIAVDGHYLMALRENQQAFFVGIRSTFYRGAMLTGTGVMPLVAGLIINATGPDPYVSTVNVQVAQQVQSPGAAIAEDVTDVDTPTDVPSVAPDIHEGSTGVPAEVFEEFAASAQTAGTVDGIQLLVAPRDLTIAPGEKGTLYVRLSAPPAENETVAVITDFDEGDKEITLAEGGRLEFTAENWDQPQAFEVSAKGTIAKPMTATFISRAGNIPLAWTVVIAGAGILFFLFFLWHNVFFPRPRMDVATPNLPPFWRPASILLASVLGPFILIYVAYRLPNDVGISAALQTVMIGEDPTSTAVKGFAFAWSAVRWIVILGIIGLLLMLAPIRKATGSFYLKASEASGIGFADVFVSFFKKKGILIMLFYLLLYRLGEAHIAKLATPFLLDTRDEGGVALTLSQYGVLYGTLGIAALTVGGILGGLLISKLGLKRWLVFALALAINVPNLAYVILAAIQPQGEILIGACIVTEYFGYGLGFAGYLMYMIYVAQGPYKTAHYALCTGFMALGMMIPGLWAGFLEELVGYVWFFVIACLLTIPGMVMIAFLPLDETFGRKASGPEDESSPPMTGEPLATDAEPKPDAKKTED
ncbi:MAG: hypothetical protein RLY93_14230 [Sumerlaeia bacterium]